MELLAAKAELGLTASAAQPSQAQEGGSGCVGGIGHQRGDSHHHTDPWVAGSLPFGLERPKFKPLP